MRIFLSYRRSDVGGYAGRLSDTLGQRLGARNVFHDVTGIAAGRDFAAELRSALDRCDAAVAVIGPGWTTATTSDGKRRLFEPDDYVRLELATVLQRNLPVAPVLVGGAALPPPEAVPDDLRPLLQRQAIEVRDESWHQDVDILLRSLRGETPSVAAVAAAQRRRALAVLGGGVVVAVLIALLLWRPWAGGSDDTGSSALPACPGPVAGWTYLPLSDTPRVDVDYGDGAVVMGVKSARWRQLEPQRWELVLDTTMDNATPADVRHADYSYTALIVGRRDFPQTCFDTPEELVRPDTVRDARTGYVVTCPPEGRIDVVLSDPRQTRLRVTEATEPGAC